MFQDLTKVMEQVSKDKGIPKATLIEAIESAMLTAARKKYGQVREIEARYNEETAEVEIFQFRTVVEEVKNELTEITMGEAHKLDPEAQVGDSIGEKLDNKFLGRIAAQTAKQVIIQKIRDAERDIVYNEYKDRVGELITGIVRRVEKGNLIVDLGRTEAIVPVKEQVRSENFKPNDRIQVYFLAIDRSSRGPQVILSRRSNGLLMKLFEMEVPEIAEKIVEIKKAAREPGARSKIAVYSKDHDVDPVGACVGMKGSRVQSVVQELRGEKIDIVSWDPDSAKFVCNAIAPAEVSRVIVREKDRCMEVVVPDDQLSLAIGKKGQNVRLAAELVGWNIDIYSETKLDEMAKRAKRILVKGLGVDEGVSTILYSQAFRTPEQIANSTFEELERIPGFSKNRLEEIQKAAKEYVEKKKQGLIVEEEEEPAPVPVIPVPVTPAPAEAAPLPEAGEGTAPLTSQEGEEKV
ncbi:MAG: transcription termination/antitermination protein NusA [Deltaproteobacteria bacterium]|nr:transcription termination/antitermination protein NusA [Deltaproteobacteria bacterium]